MNAVSMQYAPPAPSLQFHAHQLFGILLYREQGKTLGEISALLRMPEDKLGAALAVAEQGEVERVPAYSGSTPNLQFRGESTRKTLADGGAAELFLPRWQRALLRRLCSGDGEIAFTEANSIRSSYADGIEDGMGTLNYCAQGKPHGLGVFRPGRRGLLPPHR